MEKNAGDLGQTARVEQHGRHGDAVGSREEYGADQSFGGVGNLAYTQWGDESGKQSSNCAGCHEIPTYQLGGWCGVDGSLEIKAGFTAEIVLQSIYHGHGAVQECGTQPTELIDKK